MPTTPGEQQNLWTLPPGTASTAPTNCNIDKIRQRLATPQYDIQKYIRVTHYAHNETRKHYRTYFSIFQI